MVRSLNCGWGTSRQFPRRSCDQQTRRDSVERNGVTLPQAALAFPLRNSNVASIPVGVSLVKQLQENIVAGPRFLSH
jgi:aryl-alcohol dehydrogenase-like predicted oxidoreductase